MTRRPEPSDEAPIFLIPRIPGTAAMAVVGAALLAFAAVSAWFGGSRPELDEPPAAVVPVQSVRLVGDRQPALEALEAAPIGEGMWRWNAVSDSLLVVEEDGALWIEDVTDADRELLERLGVQVEEAPR